MCQKKSHLFKAKLRNVAELTQVVFRGNSGSVHFSRLPRSPYCVLQALRVQTCQSRNHCIKRQLVIMAIKEVQTK